jgi:pyridoxine/pyridoxamine 5'-phosphate oxidase
MTKAAYSEFLAARKLAVLGTVTPGGQPQGALVGYAVTEELEFVFDTLRDSRKYRNLMAYPAASLVVGWESEDTVQADGRAEELTGEALERYQKAYFEAWPDGVERLSWPGITYFVFRPSWMRYSDFSKDPPFIHEIPLTVHR